MLDMVDQVEQRLDALLDAWARWMKGGEGPEGYPSKANYLPHTFQSGYRSSEDMEAPEIERQMWAMDSAVESLPPLEHEVVFVRYGLKRARVPIPDAEYVLLNARQALLVLLRQRNVVL